MPIYEFKCEKCEKVRESIESLDTQEVRCTSCMTGKAKRIMSASNFSIWGYTASNGYSDPKPE